ncbi:large ribosomal subunit protein eL29-like [Meriones unguiculatus]|uniref:large ribosomal subunit protein eL29-like n=1 Tax=Meriones unguiculatus TaxID=10047 RepID=UPI00293F2844|nr:large ribosomal subunit protein eL29-like [Meriones unguiculatus]
MASRNPGHKDTSVLRRSTPKFLRNMPFAKKHNKKGSKKVQANNTKITSAYTEAIKALVKPIAIKPKMPKGSNCKLSHLALIDHPKQIRSYKVKGCRLCQLDFSLRSSFQRSPRPL